MRALYLDCLAGIAGDMFLGAMLDLNVFSLDDFRSLLSGLALTDYELSVQKGQRGALAGTDVTVCAEGDHGHRHLSDILDILHKSDLPEDVQNGSIRAFCLLAEAEASVHGVDVEAIHFHEVGAVDSIVDVVGAFSALHLAGVDQVYASSVNVGSGSVSCAHGILPVPSPATTRLLEGAPVTVLGAPMERTTPTGAVILRSTDCRYGPMPSGRIVATGYGLGDAETDLPNVLRATVVDLDDERLESCPWISGEASVLEANVDDMLPQDFSELMDRLFEAGAWDVFLTPVIMKKQRPGVRITCIGPLEGEQGMAEIILRYSTSIGLRCRREQRYILRRDEGVFQSSMGPVRVKRSYWGDQLLKRTLEYDDLKLLAERHAMPLMNLRARLISELGGWSDDDR
ncbi:MAG: TIGR00299 family protein [Dethiosulfovibrio peptidovorans]|nr:MAG: TIGR00299 family protein [Dethiosulfovibrio peptidovorans]